MLRFLLQRLATVIPTLFFVSILIFGLQQLLPGDPASALAGEERDPETIRYLREKFHLDEPLQVRYWYWASGVVRGALGQDDLTPAAARLTIGAVVKVREDVDRVRALDWPEPR